MPLVELEKGVHKLKPVNKGNPNGFYNIINRGETIGLIYTWRSLAGVFRETRTGTKQLIGFRFGSELMFCLTGGPAIFLRERKDPGNLFFEKLNHTVNIGFLYKYEDSENSKTILFACEGIRRNSSATNTEDSSAEKTELFLINERNKNNSGSIGTIDGFSSPPIGHEFYPVFKPIKISWKRSKEEVEGALRSLELIGLVKEHYFSFEKYKGS